MKLIQCKLFNPNYLHMKTNKESPATLPLHTDNLKQNDLEGYPLYPEEEDIYMKAKKDRKLNPDEVTSLGLPKGPANKQSLSEDLLGENLELLEVEPDEEVLLGIDDEENSYYSLGGDDHINLEENRE
jgi:hypothetical protein